MKKNLQLAFNTFWISVMLNTAVVTPHILSAKEFELNQSVSIFLLTAGISVAIFAASSVVVYIFTSLFAKMNREKSFWILMIVGIATAVLSDHLFSNSLAKYNNQTGWISAIAGFSIMCALASQYQLFLGESENADFAS
ncbi:hypothetical protein BH10BAC2_BH10BAC2_27940 [soil metagenome]